MQCSVDATSPKGRQEWLHPRNLTYWDVLLVLSKWIITPIKSIKSIKVGWIRPINMVINQLTN